MVRGEVAHDSKYSAEKPVLPKQINIFIRITTLCPCLRRPILEMDLLLASVLPFPQ